MRAEIVRLRRHLRQPGTEQRTFWACQYANAAKRLNFRGRMPIR